MSSCATTRPIGGPNASRCGWTKRPFLTPNRWPGRSAAARGRDGRQGSGVESLRRHCAAEQTQSGPAVGRKGAFLRRKPGCHRALPTADLPPRNPGCGQLAREREDWVLKSDYGCEGRKPSWARPCRKRFGKHRLNRQCRVAGLHSNASLRAGTNKAPMQLGVYLVAGAAAGLYARLSQGPTDVTALSAAARIVEA